MLKELHNLVPSEKEIKLQVFINQLTNDLYDNEKIEVDSTRLLELLSYLTSNENMSTQMKSAIEYQNKRISDVLNKIQVEKFKDYIKYLKENSIPKQKIKDKIKELKNQISIDICIENNVEKHYELKYKIQVLKELLQESEDK